MQLCQVENDETGTKQKSSASAFAVVFLLFPPISFPSFFLLPYGFCVVLRYVSLCCVMLVTWTTSVLRGGEGAGKIIFLLASLACVLPAMSS